MLCVQCGKEATLDDIGLDELRAILNQKEPRILPKYSVHVRCERSVVINQWGYSPAIAEEDADWNSMYVLGSSLHMAGYREKLR